MPDATDFSPNNVDDGLVARPTHTIQSWSDDAESDVSRPTGLDSFEKVAADAELYSLSCTQPSLSTTVAGLGSTLGHGMMVFGEWVVQNADTIALRARIRPILALRDQPDEWKVEHAETLLDLQRSVLIPAVRASLRSPTLPGSMSTPKEYERWHGPGSS